LWGDYRSERGNGENCCGIAVVNSTVIVVTLAPSLRQFKLKGKKWKRHSSILTAVEQSLIQILISRILELGAFQMKSSASFQPLAMT